MKRYALLLTAVLLAAFVLAGCSTIKESAKDTYEFMFDREPKSGPVYTEDDTPIIELNSDAADDLYRNVNQGDELPKGSPVYVRNFTNEDNPDDTARFGRVVANQVATRLAQRDLLITDGAPRPLQPLPEPEPIPEDNATDGSWFSQKKELPPRPSMLTGTYYIGDTIIYMNAKLIRLEDSVVISSASWTLPINDNVRELLPQLKQPGGLQPAVRNHF
ncbi:FlgO family outer membrane protein [Salidesulfovibrio onnuriiensis]|uniref:FlgO family outer membrane protein n=1 Tax=Salidesulfovibrio onnuriiensis TaxID=2583823 RepID=UPI0011CAEE04|nr:FlgO family outer membrane protein [Salidesulfovibrio onnuriiensis]